MKYKKIPNETKKRIKKAYESGVDLLDLAIRHGINYGTLRNLASKDKWQKGKNKTLLEQAIITSDIENRVEAREHIAKQYRDIHNATLDYITSLVESEALPTIKAKEEALKHRIQSVSESYKLAKELYSLLTPQEELELKLSLLKYEESKTIVEATQEEQNQEVEELFY